MSANRWTSRPVTVPSLFAVIVMSWIWSRPWWADISDSDRDSVNLAGLPSLRATSVVITSSGVTGIFPPNPPPTSGAMTRTFCSSMPSVSASIVRRMCGIWVADQTVTPSLLGCTTVERGSMNDGMSRCWMNLRLTVTSAPVERIVDRLAGAGGSGLEDPGVGPVRRGVRVHEVGAVGDRLLHVQHGRQHLVLDVDALERVLCLDLGACGDDGDGLTGVVDLGRRPGSGRRG